MSRTERIVFVLTPDEKVRYMRAATAVNLTVSVVIRQMLDHWSELIEAELKRDPTYLGKPPRPLPSIPFKKGG